MIKVLLCHQAMTFSKMRAITLRSHDIDAERHETGLDGIRFLRHTSRLKTRLFHAVPRQSLYLSVLSVAVRPAEREPRARADSISCIESEQDCKK